MTASPSPGQRRSPPTWKASAERNPSGRGRAATPGPTCAATWSGPTPTAPRRSKPAPTSASSMAPAPPAHRAAAPSSAGTPSAAGWSGRLDPAQAGVQQGDGLGVTLLARADAGCREPLRGEQLPRERGDRIGVDGVDLGADAVEGEQLGVREHRLPEPAGAVRGGLHREHDPALQVLLGTLQLGRV